MTMRHVPVFFGVVAAAMLAVLLGGAAAGYAGPETCNPSGRAICITIADTDGVSLSVNQPRYMRDSVTVRNGGGSTLTQLAVTIRLTDRFGDGSDRASTADYVEAQSTTACSETASPNVLTCSAPNLAAGASVTFDPLIFRTSTTAGGTATRVLVEVSVKESQREQPDPRDPTLEFFSAFEDTFFELDGNAERSWVYPGAQVALSTSKTGQFSIFPVHDVPSTAGSFVAELTESAASGSFCPTCFGEVIHTHAPGVFSATNVVEVQTVIPLANVPKGVNERSLVVHHQLDNGTVELITARCSGAIDSGTPPSSALSCARVRIDKKAGILTVEAFSGLGNGEWGVS